MLSDKGVAVVKVAGAKPKLAKPNPDFSSIDKFNYLKALLEGPAATTIQRLALSEGNYSAAVELIKERYDKTKQVIATHMDELMKIPPCSRDKAIYTYSCSL